MIIDKVQAFLVPATLMKVWEFWGIFCRSLGLYQDNWHSFMPSQQLLKPLHWLTKKPTKYGPDMPSHVSTESGLRQANCVPKVNQAYNIKALTRLMASSRTPQHIKSDQSTHFMGAAVQKWAKDNSEWWPYNPRRAALTERYNGILKADPQTLQGRTNRLHETLWDLNERPRDDKPSALRMLQKTWAFLLGIQITGKDNSLKLQIGIVNHHLLPALRTQSLKAQGKMAWKL